VQVAQAALAGDGTNMTIDWQLLSFLSIPTPFFVNALLQGPQGPPGLPGPPGHIGAPVSKGTCLGGGSSLSVGIKSQAL
jgi:hypothetical protein